MSELSIGDVIQGDCLEVMGRMEEGTVDLIVADPPYNLSSGNSMKYDGNSGSGEFGGNWDQVDENWDGFTKGQYKKFTEEWIKQSKRILKESGNIFIFGTYHNIGFVYIALQILEMDILNEIIWYKRNAFPNLSTTRLTASHENILWAYKGNDKNYTFNYDWLKGEKWIHDSFDKSNTQVRTVWNIPNNKSKDEFNSEHPTQKPLSVIDRIVQMASNEGDIVLDPFAGSGTTLVSAKKNKREYIGIEKKSEYIDICEKRIDNTSIQSDENKGVMDF